MKRTMTKMCAFVFVSLLLTGAVRSQEKATHPDLTGIWELDNKSRHLTPAKLTGAGIAQRDRGRQEAAAGKMVNYASRWCNYLGMPFLMGQSPPINVVQDKDEIGIFSEQNTAARHIYLDGRPHPAPKDFPNATNGHSVGHWEGDTLVVDTTDFSVDGLPTIPGGGYRRPESHLVETFKLINGGADMSVTFTWTDPYVFTEPHTYDFTYHRAKPGSYVFEDTCDASDAAPFDQAGGVTSRPSE